MVEIPTLDPSEAPRARRWDALVLGSGLSGLVAAARISSAGHRVLVVEEEARTVLPPAIKEPFFLGGLRDQGLLDASLRALTVPLIDRRRITTERLAYQVAADPVRLDIGQPVVTAEELVNWGLAKPEEAQTLVRHLVEASEIERALLYESPFVRLGRRTASTLKNPVGGAQTGSAAPALGHHKRGLPGAVTTASGDLSRVLDAQIRALSNLGSRRPAPEAQARLLGLALAGGAGFSDDPPWLVDLFRKRVAALYGDMRTLTGDFELVAVAGQPGIRVVRTGEIWLGRALILAAPPSALRDAYGDNPMRPAPDLLAPRAQRGYRAVFLYRVPTSILPEGMSARIILPGADASQPTAAVTAYPCQTHPNRVDLVARAVLSDVEPTTLAARTSDLRADIGDRLRALMPFCGDQLDSVDVQMPQWDSDDGWLEDPSTQDAWPGEIDLRLSSRPPIYHLNRAAAAGLGLEGDLLLGWRGGDAIAAALGT
jgi:hypothetical protein